ncbi:Hypothetical protein EUBREC_0333 [Agathobacter rectalis ATCC 33656]|uniref:Uncharacterized protein n=1 Tax=Agathobacter rectalis (strain ATCC 33656 / DSM 3377 / JCM 17463 / KCTC 5835 / VPI 0990) TaxID=515619 RepID=C4ZB61_AGARV|nr:Hypothetical protein EUBREC_0333 [Agathobacter rectalis ATCC 33656]
MCFALGGCVHRCSIQYIPQKNMKSAAGFRVDSVWNEFSHSCYFT